MGSPTNPSVLESPDDAGVATSRPNTGPAASVPWQIWIVVVVLGLEGIGNLFSIPGQPAALFWLLAKCLFIVGLLKRWIWVYCLFLAIAVIHVVYFLPISLVASLMNLILVVLAASARRFYVSGN